MSSMQNSKDNPFKTPKELKKCISSLISPECPSLIWLLLFQALKAHFLRFTLNISILIFNRLGRNGSVDWNQHALLTPVLLTKQKNKLFTFRIQVSVFYQIKTSLIILSNHHTPKKSNKEMSDLLLFILGQHILVCLLHCIFIFF